MLDGDRVGLALADRLPRSSRLTSSSSVPKKKKNSLKALSQTHMTAEARDNYFQFMTELRENQIISVDGMPLSLS